MNILILTNHFKPESFRINDLSNGLVERGHGVSVMTSIPNYPLGKFFDGYGIMKRRKEVVDSISIQRVPVVPRGDGSSLRLALNYISSCLSFCTMALFSKKKFDVVFVFGTSPLTICLPAIIIKLKHKTPIVLWVLDLWPESLSAAGGIHNCIVLGFIRKVIEFSYRKSDKILVSCKGFIHKIQPALQSTEVCVEYFPNWIESEISNGIGTNSSLPNLPGGFNIVFTGNVGEAQDWRKVVAAAKELRNVGDVNWIIVGEGRKSDWLKRAVHTHALEGKFHLVGRFPIEMMSHFYDGASCLLLTLNNSENFKLTVPGKLQSYMASGKPVIAALEGEGAEVVKEAQCGVVCQTNTSAELVNSIMKIYHMSEFDRNKLGANGLAYSEKNFSRGKLFNKVEEILEKCVNSHVG